MNLEKAKRMSVGAIWALANQDNDVEDDLSKAQKKLKHLKAKISTQSKKNFLLEQDVRYLDSRIALLIHHRNAQETEELASHLEEDSEKPMTSIPEDRKRQHYGNLFFLLQTVPRYIADLARLVSMSEMDTLLQTVMFTLYGNQYEPREEHLLLSVFQLVLTTQFEETKDGEMGTLMRANTPVSRMMTTYTRRGPGQHYLKSVLSSCLKSLAQQNDVNLEINPLKVYEQMINDMEVETGQDSPLPRGVTYDVAATNQQVQNLIAPRLVKLRELSEVFLNVILNSLEMVPYGIRWICKQIRLLAKRAFPDASDFAVGSLIGAFYMLRFMNPAIVAPQAYMLDESQGTMSGFCRRTVTMIAKMLQNLTNKPNYSKEAYMLPLNGFVDDNKERMTKFFFDLCEVEDFFEQLEIDQYIALTKKEISLDITLNELYNTHELLVKHMDPLVPEEDDHLRIVLTDLGPAPKQLPRSENRPLQLTLFSRWQTPINDELTKTLKGQNVSANELLYLNTKTAIVQILRGMPPPKGKPLSLPAVLTSATNYKANSRIQKKAIKAKDDLRDLEACGVVSAQDNYAQLANEVLAELMDLEKLREKVSNELESLDGVHAIIRDHNTYLKSQIESYGAYLENVRIQSGKAKTQASTKKGGGSLPQFIGPYKFTHNQLERDGIIIDSDVPENRRSNIYFQIASPIPGTFIIALHYKGRDKPILELDLKLDDLLEKQHANDQTLDLEYVQLNVNKMLHLLNKTFLRR
eukprot:Lithocolla_globosa_v1_NODE_1599_length_2457_cov_19.375520.p1 type:complete len:750 gc:universal NODE_1599_length_2457_cov_19.375520:74-2323(+)